MSQLGDNEKIIVTLETFQKSFDDYAAYIFDRPGAPEPQHAKELLRELRRMEPKVTDIITKIDGERYYTIGSMVARATLSNRDLIRSALLGGNNAMPIISQITTR